MSIAISSRNPSKEELINLKDYLIRAKTFAYGQYNLRNAMMKIDRDYMRENNFTSENEGAKQANAMGDATKIQDVTIPITQSQVETAVTYQASVFLTGVPLFGVVSKPETMDQALQLESKIDADAIRCGMTQEILELFRNGYKYNFGAAEVTWEQELDYSAETDVTDKNSVKKKKVVWAGNKTKCLDMYNTFWDVRFDVSEVALRGEFAGYSEIINKIELINFFRKDPYANNQKRKDAAEAPITSLTSAATAGDATSYFVPQISPNTLLQPRSNGIDWSAWMGLTQSGSSKINYKDTYLKTVMYCRIVPAQLGMDVPAKNTPQIWRFVFINDSVLVASNPITTYRDTLPILFFKPKKDGLKYQTKSFAEDSREFQATASALMAANLASRRRAISDRALFDPSRVSAAAINSPNPSAKIPVRPAAYGKPLSEAVYPFPFREDQQGIISQEISSLVAMSNTLAGQNQATQGQFTKGNRTMQEFDSVMMNARGKDQVFAMQAEAQFFTPLKEILKYNTLMFMVPETVYSRSTEQFIKTNPDELRRAMLQFKVSDGLVPSQKLLNGESFSVALQTIASSSIGGAYNVGTLFSYLMKSQGADISFAEKSKEQVTYEQAVVAWQQTVAEVAKYHPKDSTSPPTFPPQPTPQQFGYDPAKPIMSVSQKNAGMPLLTQVSQAIAPQQTQPTRQVAQ